MRLTGIVPLSMSTMRMREVTENRPPSLYIFSLKTRHVSSRREYRTARVPLGVPQLVANDLQPHAHLLSEAPFLLRGRVDYEHELLRHVVDLELLAEYQSAHTSPHIRRGEEVSARRW
jgi:hypothetical protein